ncbi:hypothetical protein INT45_001534, partial [Circinella minor]
QLVLERADVIRKRTIAVEIVERRERAYHIDAQYHWDPSSIEFSIIEKKCATTQQEDALSELKVLVISRAIMNEQLRGRAGKLGEHVSTNVKKSIVKIGKDAKKHLESYNEASRVLREPEITWEKICNPAAPFWERTIMQKEFDILREIMNKRRAEEELQLVEDELLRLKNYANSRCRALELGIIQESRGNGWRQLLFDYLDEAELLWSSVNEGWIRVRSADIVALESLDVTISSAENDTNVICEDEYDEEEHFVMEYEEWENNLIEADSDEEDVNDDNSSIN